MKTAMVGRRWAVPWRRRTSLLAAVGLATLAALVYVHQPHGYYWSDTSVYFIAPLDTTHTNAYTFTTDGVIATAGLVGHLVQPRETTAGTSTDTTLLALGVTKGHQIRLPNSGGQWDSNFDKPSLDVQVVGDSPDEVRAENERLMAKIGAQLDKLQVGVSQKLRISLSVSPTETQVSYTEGDPRRAMAGVLLLGTILGAATLSWSARRPWARPDAVPADRARSASGPPPRVLEPTLNSL